MERRKYVKEIARIPCYAIEKKDGTTTKAVFGKHDGKEVMVIRRNAMCVEVVFTEVSETMKAGFTLYEPKR